ncbi:MULTISPECIES: hypothetical protein [unclassified Pseudomonas]|jgi:hypothetical protein|uniref:hypothetical protein n=1 Tax=unclassified Pseudomonas TaxID=196821 RepID=UPI000756B84B|nr:MULTISPECIES: hypothetical protein [unclassified Pseudomonas]KVV01747.1 hypothetical protein AP060_03467 [Pseudomonas sp. TAD18]KVV03317.1 hypothetical protein AP059_03701 [Pseudomonas sp. TAA207]
MNIRLGGIRADASLTLEKKGDALIVNGELFDFSRIEEGDSLPDTALMSKVNRHFFLSPITRVDGQLTLVLMLPYGEGASSAQVFPEPIVIDLDGEIRLPQPDKIIAPDPLPMENALHE